jgi:hypothetical protein
MPCPGELCHQNSIRSLGLTTSFPPAGSRCPPAAHRSTCPGSEAGRSREALAAHGSPQGVILKRHGLSVTLLPDGCNLQHNVEIMCLKRLFVFSNLTCIDVRRSTSCVSQRSFEGPYGPYAGCGDVTSAPSPVPAWAIGPFLLLHLP